MDRDELYTAIEKALGEYVLERIEAYKKAPESLCGSDLEALRIYLGIRHNPVMTSQDLAYLLKRPRGSVFWCVQQAGTSGVLLEGEHLRDFKNENGIHSTVSNIMIYHGCVVEAVLKAYSCYEEHKEFLDEYFALECEPSMSRDDMRAAVQQAHLLLTIAREIQNPKIKEQNLMAVTALLINIGLWTEKRAGFNGITANWGINTLEGCNKLAVLQDARRQWKY